MNQTRHSIAVFALGGLLLAGLILFIVVQQRVASCAYIPGLAENLLPNAAMAIPGNASPLPQGWTAGAPGVQVGRFAVDGDERAMQLMGIANYVQPPPVAVQPGRSYCLTAMTITDSQQGSTSRVQVVFHWLDGQGQTLAADTAPWQRAVRWEPDNPPEHWSRIGAAFRAPSHAHTLLIRLHPSSDDRIYLDAFQVRQGGTAQQSIAQAEQQVAGAHNPVSSSGPALHPWPRGKRAALSLSFDWETAMGGLVHSRSVGEPFADQDPEQRGLRMREGITTTLEIFRPYGIRATYYATGYNFLRGNTERAQFMGNPTYSWANMANGWPSDLWETTPWFAPDPYGTVESHPAWYFGDLVPRLLAERQDIQSHTFSHFYGGLVGPQDWRDDTAAWNAVAAMQGVPPMRSLAFPWSSSGGMSDANWRVLVAAGVTAVTRLSDQGQYNLFPTDEGGLVRAPQCRPLPGHREILACPDFYLTPGSVERALQQVERIREQGGMVDLWSHTEEVVTSEQRAAWQRVVDYAAAAPDLWIAPLREIADWQQALGRVELRTEQGGAGNENAAPLAFSIMNGSVYNLDGLTVRLPFAADRVRVNSVLCEEAEAACEVLDGRFLVLSPRAGETLEIYVWPRT